MLKSAVKQKIVVISSVPFGKLLAEYRLSLEAMNRSCKTIPWYVEILQRYFAFLDSNSLLKPIQQLATHEIKLYILHLANANRWANHPNVKKAKGKLSPYSVQGHVRAIKAFWGWLEREGYIASNPLAKLPLPKVPDKPVSILSSEQINKLITQIDRSTPKGARYYAILFLLLDTGIRVGELVSIRIEDLDLQHGCVHVLGKGHKFRSVPISKLTQKELMRYVHHFRVHLCPTESPYLFPRENTTSISANSVQQFLHRLANKAGLKGVRCSPHVFRHTFATQSIANGANVFVLKDIMGHSTLATTMKYVHLQLHDLQIHHAKFSPLTTLNLGNASYK
jgi:site-specific recombinase XerD